MVDTWKTVKIIYVFKYIFWNIIIGAALLVSTSPIVVDELTFEEYQDEVAASYVRKFFVTFGLIGIIFVTFMIKILLGLLYSIKYRFCKKSIRIHKTDKRVNMESKITAYFDDMKDTIY